MQLTLGGVVALSVAILAGEARAAPLILRCDGIATYNSPYEPTPTRVATQRYYRIDQQQFSRFQPADIVWPGNYCTKKGATCSADENTFNARWTDGRSVVTVQINRKSGRVLDATDGVDFIGDCAPSADPAQSSGPNKF